MSEDFQNEYIKVESSLHHYRTEIPNIIFQMKLEPYEFKAYCVLKMTAGDNGSCFKSTKTLCEEIGCERPKFVEIKRNLQKRGLITLLPRKHPNGGDLPDLITIVDVWGYNMKTMMEKYQKGGGNLKLRGGIINDYGGGNLGLHKEEHNEEEKKQQHVAAVFLENSIQEQKPEMPKIYPLLEHVDIPDVDKIEITRRYDIESVKNAIAWAIASKDKLTKPLAAGIKWACQNKPEMPKNEFDQVKENKSYVMKYDGVKNQYARVDVLTNSVEITYLGGQKQPICIEYDAKGFMEQFKNALRKVEIKLL